MKVLQKWKCLTDNAFSSEESPNTGEKMQHHNQSNPTTLTATLITCANINISMRQTDENVSHLTLKLAFRVRKDFALIFNWYDGKYWYSEKEINCEKYIKFNKI